MPWLVTLIVTIGLGQVPLEPPLPRVPVENCPSDAEQRAAAAADSRTITLRSVLLVPGTPKNCVLSELRRQFTVVELEPELWGIFTDRSPVTALGKVSFRDGRLLWSSRVWVEFGSDRTAHQVVEQLFAALVSLAGEGEHVVRLRVKSLRQPDSKGEAIGLELGGRLLIITRVEGPVTALAIEESNQVGKIPALPLPRYH